MMFSFYSVGARKLTWNAAAMCNPGDYDDIAATAVRLVRKKKALGSRGIDAVMCTHYEGVIIAGLRTVGRFKVADLSPESFT